MLNAVLQHHLKQHTSAVSHDIQANLYMMDTVISGCDIEQEAIKYHEEARTIMSSTNFNLRSWSSNSAKLKAIATQENTSDDSSTVNILGLCWNMSTDKILLAAKSSTSVHDNLITKRVLQDLSNIFDPLGFIDPVVIQAKMLMFCGC